MQENIKAVALTIDDGPRASTEKILDILEKYGAHATFFLIGNQIDKNFSPVLHRMKNIGCEIGNHGMNHRVDENIAEEFSMGQDVIYKYSGVHPTLFRPARLKQTELMYKTVPLPVIGGYLNHLQCPDWDDSVTLEARLDNMKHQIVDGRIILIHDTAPNLEMLEIMIPEIQSKGFRILTVTEMFELKGKKPPRNGEMLNEYK